MTTAGFRDVLEIAQHWRTDLYDPFTDQAQPLVPRELRFEVDERLAADGEELRPLSLPDARAVIERLRETDVEAVAVSFLHSYRDPRQEEQMTDLLRSADGWAVCGSADLARELREYERTSTIVLNAALMPMIDSYLTRLEAGLDAAGNHASLFVTQSNGGALTTRATRLRPVSLALSGPVGGVVGCVDVGRRIGRGDLIGLDMGGRAPTSRSSTTTSRATRPNSRSVSCRCGCRASRCTRSVRGEARSRPWTPAARSASARPAPAPSRGRPRTCP